MGILDGLLGGGKDGGFDAARDANAQNRALYDQLDLPEYEQYIPQLYNSESAKYQLTQDDPVAKSAQLSALAKMADLSNTGMSPIDEAGYMKARSEGDQMQRAGTESALANAQARGVAGSGMEFAMREMANQAGAQKAQEAGLAQAADSARQRALYSQAYLTGTGTARDQDYKTNANNTNIVNEFNKANTTTRNATNNANVDARNSAFKYNEGLKDKNFNNELTKDNAISGVNNRTGEIGAAEAEAERKRRAAVGGAIGGIGGAALSGSPAGAAAGSGIGQALF